MSPRGATPAGPSPLATSALANPDVRAAVARFRAEPPAHHAFAEAVAERAVEYEGLAELLLTHATAGVDATETALVASSIAAGSLGERHLWRDLELPSRAALRGLFEAYFQPLAADNVMDMRWKKFLYRKLCRWGGFASCRAPSCSVCESYDECFGTAT